MTGPDLRVRSAHEGLTVDDPADLEDVFHGAAACGRTVVIDVKTDRNCPTPVYDFAAGAKAWSYHE